MTTRPAHADPTLWDHAVLFDFVLVLSPWFKPHPIAHRVESIMDNDGWWHGDVRAECGSGMAVDHERKVATRIAAQYALPCRRCWPDADPDATTARRYGDNS